MKIRIAENVKNLRTLQVVKAQLASEKRRERLEATAAELGADLRNREEFEICVRLVDGQ